MFHIRLQKENKVNITKYKTTYDKVTAIYKWYTQNTKRFINCESCNSYFVDTIYYLFGDFYARNLCLTTGKYRNNNGKLENHTWSVIYLSGVPYQFDPRMQKYIKPSGMSYFGFGMNSNTSKNIMFSNLGWEAGMREIYL